VSKGVYRQQFIVQINFILPRVCIDVNDHTKVEGPWPDVWVDICLKSVVSISM